MIYNIVFLTLVRLTLRRRVTLVVAYASYAVFTIGLMLWRLAAAGIDVGATPSPSDFSETGWSYAEWAVVLTVVLIALVLLVVLVGALRPYAVIANIVLLVATYLIEGLPWALLYWGWPVLLAVAVAWGAVALVPGGGGK